MSRQWVIILALVAFLGIGLIWLLNTPVPNEATIEDGHMLPALRANVNDIQALDIIAPGGAVAVSLRRVGDVEAENSLRWRVVQRDGYEADFARVFGLLRDLAELRQAEARTANPDWYQRLGVSDVGSEQATGRRLDFPLNDLPSLIIGQLDPTGQGSYARLDSDAQSWLLDRVIELPLDPVQWLEPSIMDIPASDISQIMIRHADGEIVELVNAGTEQSDFVLLNVPEQRQAGPAFQRTALANGLRGLNLEDVRAFDPEQVPIDAVRVLFTTHDGLDFVATLFEQANSDDDADGPAAESVTTTYWVHFSISATAAVASESTESAGASQAADSAVDGQADPESDRGAELQAAVEAGVPGVPDASETLVGDALASARTVEDEHHVDSATAAYNERLVNAVAVDARLSPWLFAIPQRKFDEIVLRLEDLLEPLPEPDTQSAPTSG
ncbi:MAG: DUF4340 domain-containing protein [Pseudomonadota bacterium]